jgi:hypothetical protein
MLHWKIGLSCIAVSVLVVVSAVGGFTDGFWF